WGADGAQAASSAAAASAAPAVRGGSFRWSRMLGGWASGLNRRVEYNLPCARRAVASGPLAGTPQQRRLRSVELVEHQPDPPSAGRSTSRIFRQPDRPPAAPSASSILYRPPGRIHLAAIPPYTGLSQMSLPDRRRIPRAAL